MKLTIGDHMNSRFAKFHTCLLGIVLGGTSVLGDDVFAQDIRFAHMNTPQHDIQKWGERLKAGVERRTNNAVKVSLFPSAQLGENAQVTEQISLGADIMAQVGPGHLVSYNPDYQILSGPFLFANWGEAERLFRSDLARSWEERMDKSNIKLLCFADFGVRNLYTAKKSVKSVADLTGMKLRVQPLPIFTEMVKAMGAAPTPMPWPEVYSALAQGVIDAAEAPPGAMLDQKHYENAKYYILTNHVLEPLPFVVGKRTFNKMKPEHQKIFEEEARSACSWLSEQTAKSYEAGIKDIESRGVTIVRDIDRKSFIDATKVVYTKFPNWSPGLYDKVRAAIANTK